MYESHLLANSLSNAVEVQILITRRSINSPLGSPQAALSGQYTIMALHKGLIDSFLKNQVSKLCATI